MKKYLHNWGTYESRQILTLGEDYKRFERASCEAQGQKRGSELCETDYYRYITYYMQEVKKHQCAHK